ncbi:MAG: hypothetical protein C0404_05425 [Verrucomicrobia bacterium]|nr:hypothetical protein [Verrucomicrobiota bacterium]
MTRFYVDGVMVGASDRKSSTDVYAVGNYQSDNQRFADRIDDVRIYNCAIPTQQIAALAVGNNLAPTAAISASKSGGDAPLTVDFNGTGSSDADGAIVKYSWSFGDRQGAMGAIVSHTYTSPGSHQATLVVTDDKGETDARTVTITVSALAACWSLDDGSGTNALDGACGNNGALVNGPVWTTGKVGGGLLFDGANDSVSVQTAPYAGVVNSFTIAFWAKPQAARTVTAESASGATGTSGQRYAIYPTQGNGAYGAGHAGAGISVGTNGVSVFEHADGYLPSPLVYDAVLTNWTHVAVLYANGRPTLYLNGVAVRTGVASSKTVHPGCSMGGSSYGWYQGVLDDVRIYNGVLSDEALGVLAVGGAPDLDADGIPDASDTDDDNDGLPDTWEIANGLNSRSAGDANGDADGDGMSNLAEYIAGTNPRNSEERFEVSGCGSQDAEYRLGFLTVTGRLYGVLCRSNLFEGVWHELTNNVPGTGGQVEVRDPAVGGTGPQGGAQKYYRIKVKLQ